jgi:hypothetical protein
MFHKGCSADDVAGFGHNENVLRVVKAGWQAERLWKRMKY